MTTNPNAVPPVVWSIAPMLSVRAACLAFTLARWDPTEED